MSNLWRPRDAGNVTPINFDLRPIELKQRLLWELLPTLAARSGSCTFDVGAFRYGVRSERKEGFAGRVEAIRRALALALLAVASNGTIPLSWSEPGGSSVHVVSKYGTATGEGTHTGRLTRIRPRKVTLSDVKNLNAPSRDVRHETQLAQ